MCFAYFGPISHLAPIGQYLERNPDDCFVVMITVDDVTVGGEGDNN